LNEEKTMPKHYEGPWILRSMLFVPGHKVRYLESAAKGNADAIILDLEDAVPADQRELARETISDCLAQGMFVHKQVFVRVNPRESGLLLEDLNAVARKEVDGFVYPKAYRGKDVEAFDAQLDLMETGLGLPRGHFVVVPLIETTSAVLYAHEIATASNRVVALAFGCEDFNTDLQGLDSPEALAFLVPRAMIAMACRAAGIEPVDTVFVHLNDHEGLERNIKIARELGFSGMLIVHPKQIPIAHRYYTPSDEQIAHAQLVVEKCDQARSEGSGVAFIGGEFIGPPFEERARKLVSRFKALEAIENDIERS
jgi:citrate lyase subunit beta/citryl-CoA lyase